MKRNLLLSFIVPCVLASTQSGMAVEPKLNDSAVVLAAAKEPSGMALVAAAAGAANASLLSANGVAHAALKESVKAEFTGQNMVDAAMRGGGTLEYKLRLEAPMSAQTPKVTKAVEVELTPAELAAAPAQTVVTLHAIVDENGVPRNVQITKSTGIASVDEKAIAAMNQYRFKPALVDNLATWSGVSVTIRIQK